jgi:large conductance mechanosensitive channel
MIREFREFVLKGNLLELAVAFIMGLAFAAVVNAFVAGIVLPLIAAALGKPNFDALTFRVGEGVVRYGTFLTALVNFLLIALVLFLAIRAYNRLRRPEEPATRVCPYCRSDIPKEATRCPACTSELGMTPA